MILADTNVVSELMKDAPDGNVVAWADAHPVDGLVICVVTVEEIERGIGRLPEGRRRADLEGRWRRLLTIHAESVLPYDLAAAQATARVVNARTAQGSQISLADAQIAGICLARGAALATRNVKDFVGVDGLLVLNPFDAGA